MFSWIKKKFCCILHSGNFSLVMNKGEVVQQKLMDQFTDNNRSASQFLDIKCSAIKHFYLACFVNENSLHKNIYNDNFNGINALHRCTVMQ